MITERPVFEEETQIITVGNDAGKEVVIHTEAIINEHVKVVQGPYRLRMKTHTNANKKNPDGRSKEVIVITEPYWLAKLENGFYIHFAKEEFKFIHK